MAKFTASVPLNFTHGGYRICGAAGATYRIDDGMAESFDAEFGDRIPGLTWITQDESSSYGGDGGAHPDAATHVTLGLAFGSHNHDGSYSSNGHNHNGAYSALVHTHAESQVTNLVSDLAGKAATVHTHAQSSVTNLVTDLAGKAASSHSHVDGDLPAGIARDTEVAAAIVAHEASATHGQGGGGSPYAVGDIYITTSTVDPATRWAGTTWERFAAGRVVMGFDSTQAGFDTIEETGGAATHGHTVTQPDAHTQVINHTHPITDPGHVHDEFRNSATTGGLDGWAAGDTSTNTPLLTGYDTGSKATGITVNNPAGGVSSIPHSGTAVANGSSLAPYVTAFFWKRTA